ncbi:hypothetical protein JW935_23680 [candidate division KSB1 bacterium]|nr:hypothetical protein [candidate division KSB1 bacterium]
MNWEKEDKRSEHREIKLNKNGRCFAGTSIPRLDLYMNTGNRKIPTLISRTRRWLLQTPGVVV